MHLSCIDAGSGKLIWRNTEFKDVPNFFAASSPIVTDGLCIVPLGGRGSGAVVAFDLASGNQKWKWTGEAPTYSSPVLMTADGVKQIVTPTEKSVVGIALADGKLLWQIPAQTQRMTYNAPTPVVDGQTVILTGQGAGTRAVKIEKQGDTFATKELWSNAETGTTFNTPVLKDNHLFGISDRGNFFCIDTTSGKTLWTGPSVSGVQGGPPGGGPPGGGPGGPGGGRRGGGMRGGNNFGSILDAGSVMLALPANGELVVFKPSDTKYEEVARIKVSDSATYAHPVVSGNRVFIKDQDSVAALTIE